MWILREDPFRLTEHDEDLDADRIRREWLMRLDRGKSFFVEKSPPNTARTPWLQHHFENAAFVALVRNGYAVAEGIRRKAEPRHRRVGWPIELCARQWARSYEVVLEDEEHLDRVHWVRYEDFVEAPEERTRKILDFLGVNDNEQAINFDRTWSVHEREEAIRNMNPESFSRLTDEDIRTISREAGPMLREMGYEVR